MADYLATTTLKLSETDIEDFTDPFRFIYRITNDPCFFLQAIWIDRGLYKVAPLSDVELDMFDYICNGPAHLSTEECRRRALLAFRGEGKTYKICALCCYRYRRDSKRQILVISKSEKEVKKTCRLVRRWLKIVWFLSDLEPGPDEADAATYFDLGGMGSNDGRQYSFACIGVTGQLEGNRGHTVIGDDIETKGNSRTLDARITLRSLVNELTNIVFPYQPHDKGGPVDPSEIVIVGTPKHEETVYVELAKQELPYTIRSYPLVLPGPTENVISLASILQARLDSGEKPGTPVLPLRFNEHEVAIRRGGGYAEWCREFMLIADLADSNSHPLRLRDLIVMSVNRDIAPIRVAWGTSDHSGSTAIPSTEIQSYGLGDDRLFRPVYVEREHWEPYTGTKAGLDPAGRGEDKTGLAIVKHLTGTLWCPVVRGFPGGTDPDKLETIVSMLREFDTREVYFETNIDVFGAYQTALEMAISRMMVKPGEDPRFPNGWSCRVERIRAHGMKEERIIDVIEPVISTHRLVVDPSVVTPERPYIQKDCFQYQLTRMMKQPKCLKEDGKLDALSIVIKAWMEHLKIDPLKSGDNREKRILQGHLAKLRGFFGSTTSSVLSRPGAARNQ